MSTDAMSWVQAHKSVFNGRPIAAAPTPFRPARLSVRVRAEDIEKKAEQAKDKVQEKAGEVANKASGKVNWNRDTYSVPRIPNDSHA